MATAPSPTTSSRSRAACGQGRSTQRRHERPPRRPRPARHGEVVPRLDSGGGAPHADEQPRAGRGGATPGSGRVRRYREGRARLARVRRDLPHAPHAGRRRNAAGAVGKAGRGVHDPPGGPPRAHRECESGRALGDLGRVPRARAPGADHVRTDDRRVVDLHRQSGDPARHLRDVRRHGTAALRRSAPAEYLQRSMASIAAHVEAMLAFKRRGAVTFDYGNNIRAQARDAGVTDAFDIPGFVPEYIRPLFCEGKGPFRWVALSGDPEDIYRTDRAVLEEFPGDEALGRWIRLAREKVQFQGLPARICWLGYGERARLGLRFNEMVRTGELKAPIVIGRDHLDSGSVASPNRETEGMKDGSDAIADWPILNALVRTAAGASGVSIHPRGGGG